MKLFKFLAISSVAFSQYVADTDGKCRLLEATCDHEGKFIYRNQFFWTYFFVIFLPIFVFFFLYFFDFFIDFLSCFLDFFHFLDYLTFIRFLSFFYYCPTFLDFCHFPNSSAKIFLFFFFIF